MRTLKLSENTKQNLLNDLLKRSPNNYGQYEDIVADIISQVRTKGMRLSFLIPANLTTVKFRLKIFLSPERKSKRPLNR